MKLVVVSVLLLVACTNGVGDDSYPVTPPGGGGGGQGGGGGGGGDGGTTMDIAGRVCILGPDMRDLTPPTCVTPAGGLVVQLGTKMATTESNGAFTITGASTSTDQRWSVTGVVTPGNLAITPSVMRFNTTSFLIPAMLDKDYTALLSDHGIIISGTEGAVLAHLTSDNADTSQMNATSVVMNGESQQTYYDGPNANVWLTNASATAGMAWMPDNQAGDRMALTTYQATVKTFSVHIDAGAITYVKWKVTP